MLGTAFAPVPGTSPHGAALLAMVAAVRADVDLVTVKTETLSHVERLGDARMFRVPVGDGDPLEQREAFDRAVARQLDAERYDVVHVRGPFEGALAAQRKAELGFQFVYEMATFPDEALGAEVERLWHDVHQRCLAAADLVLVPTEAARRGLLEANAELRRVEVLPPGVDVGTFDWRSTPPSDTSRLLYLGTFTADREIATLLEAVRRVRSKRRLRVLLAGDADRSRRERTRQLVQAFGLQDCVDVRGEPAASGIAAIIASADVCIAPAAAAPRFQTLGDLPQPLLEYLACHRPVIAAAVPGVGEVMRDELEGLVYPPGDDETLAAAILELLGSPGTAERLTEAGYRRVRDLYSSGARRRRIANIYASFLPGIEEDDPWATDFGPEALDEDLGPSESDIEAAEAALRGELEPSGAESIPLLEGSSVDLEPVSTGSILEEDLIDGLTSEPGLDGLTSESGLDELASEPTVAFASITDIGIESPTSSDGEGTGSDRRIDTDPGHLIAEPTRPKAR